MKKNIGDIFYYKVFLFVIKKQLWTLFDDFKVKNITIQYIWTFNKI